MKNYIPWGKSVSINLYDCDHDKLIDPQIIKKFIADVIKKIGMVAHGPTHIDKFGDKDSGLEGYSAMQFIETSSITIHCDDVSNRAFIDIFSCKDFSGDAAETFAKKYFGAHKSTVFSLAR